MSSANHSVGIAGSSGVRAESWLFVSFVAYSGAVGYARMHARKASCIGCTLAGGVGDPPVREWQFLAISEWMDPATTDDNVAWARETFAAMLPFTANQLRYMNYLDEDDMRGDPTRTAYGPASGLSAGDLPGSTACSAARRAVRGVLRRFRRARVAGTAQAPGGFGNVGRWAYLGLNQGPPACEAGALPLSYTPGKRPGMLADGSCAPAEPAPPRTEWEGFEPSRRVNPAHAISSRAPSAARTPLQAVPSIARRSSGKTPSALFPLRATFRVAGRLRRVGWVP